MKETYWVLYERGGHKSDTVVSVDPSELSPEDFPRALKSEICPYRAADREDNYPGQSPSEVTLLNWKKL